MHYIKSILTWLAAAVLSLILATVAGIALSVHEQSSGLGAAAGGISRDVLVRVHGNSVALDLPVWAWFAGPTMFIVGFVWMFDRSLKKRSAR